MRDTVEAREAVGEVVKFWIDRGTGFIRTSMNGCDIDVFMHYKNIEPEVKGYKKVAVGDTVKFDIIRDNIGLTAKNISIIESIYKN